MKNATKHAAAIKSLMKRLARQQKAGERPAGGDPLRALVAAVLLEDCDERLAAGALSAFDAEFVDVNELRVATELELVDLMGERYPNAGERSVRLRELLMSLFDAEGRLSAERLAALNRKDQRQAIRSVPHMTPFIEGYVALVGFGAAAVPVDGMTLSYLASHDIVEPEATAEEAQRFLEAHLKSDECWPFFVGSRAEALRPRARRARAGSARKVAKTTSKSGASPAGAASRRPARRAGRTRKQSA